MNDTPLKNKGESKVLSKEIYTLYNEINAARKERGWTYLTDKELNTNLRIMVKQIMKNFPQ